MGEPTEALSMLVLLVGVLVVSAMLTKAGLDRLRVPPLVGFLALGLALRLVNDRTALLGPPEVEVLEFLAILGVIVLLFRVGLESNLRGLLQHIRGSALIWLGNVSVSALAGYLVCRYLLGLGNVPSLVVGVAMTATSVAVPTAVWQRADALKSKQGLRFLDIAELDDISGVLFMAVLFAVLPLLKSPGRADLSLVIARETGWFLLKLAVFTAVCLAFSLYVEERLMRFFRKMEPEPHPMLMVVGLGMATAAVAAVLGFSSAVGAFFAGLIFSRDPQRVRVDTSFSSLYELFAPFFFIGIGFRLAPTSLLSGLALGSVLVVVAVLGKVVGTAAPALLNCTWYGAVLLGVSMIPRAEITMVIMQRAHARGDWAVPESVYSGMVLVCAITCIAAPWVLNSLLTSRTGQRVVEK